ncbi:DUF3168 domain-containing protein [Streptomyces sp. NPDC046316]|uniref:DUF3168 domain-containing protein n=1 Tax=Streptomyces sp. NPDC046316 TaxID=3154494 RepID=UPI00340A7AF9
MTSPLPLLPVQSALYARLTGDSTLMNLVTGVYDFVPETAVYPYIHIGEAIETPDNAHDRFGRQTVHTLHVWDRYKGFKRVLQIGSRANALLDHQPLAITGLAHVVTRYEFGQPLTDPEPPGDIRHLVLRYRIVTEQIP